MSTAIVPIQDIEKMATAVAKSGLFGIKNAEQGVALMLIAQAEGLHPAIAARDYHIIQGRPALKADAMLARFQTAGGKVSWTTYTDQEVTGEFSHPQGGSVSVTWTMDMARKIGLAGKDNWKNFPRAMLRARVVSEGIRTCYPGCVVGVYTPEEVQDFEPPKTFYKGAAEVVSMPEPVQTVEEAPVAVVEPSGPTEPPWVLQIPGKEAQHCLDADDFGQSMLNVCAKLNNPKLTALDRDEKLKVISTANADTFARLGLKESVELMGLMRKAAHGSAAEKQQ